ncbi:MAG: ornithine cyclodeaminase family protein [Candidatus Eiseniibacteriota bacterium]
MNPVETLTLTASDIARCLTPSTCRTAVEQAFALLAEGRVPAARSSGFESPLGTFHAKLALYDAGRARFVAKINGNFPKNLATSGLPTVQGVLILSDAADGRPLAIMDSAMVTALRTAAASAVAADHLARRDAAVLAVVGCGLQGAPHITALSEVRPIREIRLYDMVAERAAALARQHQGGGLSCRAVTSIAEATHGADLVATCTTGGAFVLDRADVDPGTFVAAVGTDNPHKREIAPGLMSAACVVVDDLDQCARGGDLHHAIAAGAMTADDVHSDLARVVAGRHPPLTDQVVVFDSTGVALEDAAAADFVYERARELGLGHAIRLAQ